jgi:acetyl-CoA C-acetyltransferase
MNEVVIVSATRTAGGRLGGVLKDVQPEDLTKVVILDALKRANVEAEAVDEVIIGQAKQSADAANLARVAMLKAGLPIETPAYTVMRQCGSGLQAINNAAQQIMLGMSDIVVAGGVESMSNAVYYLRNARYGYGAGNGVLVDSNTESQPRSQPFEVYGNITMGLTAENLAEKFDISREEQDAFALQSQERALAAMESGKFAEEIVGVVIPQKKKDPITVDTDEHPRKTSMEALAKLPAVFKKEGTVTAGNASGRNDGAAAAVVMSAKEAERRGLQPMAYIRSQAVAGVPPEIMGFGPAPASRKALKLAGLTFDDLGVIELNEAFAAQALACIKDLGIGDRMADINPNGGAIALGHPLGCSGARIFTTLLYEMGRRGSRYGLATLCIAGGQGIATVVESAL